MVADRDDRALAELSFAAMSAGEQDLARKAGRQAVLTATEPKIRAAALYNLGRVEEPGDPAKAAALYRASLALRPNAANAWWLEATRLRALGLPLLHSRNELLC